MEVGVRLLEAYVQQMKMAISFANGSPPISTGVNIAKQFLCIFRNLSSIQLFSIEENVPTSTSEGMEAS